MKFLFILLLLAFLNPSSASYAHDEYGDPCMATAELFDFDCDISVSTHKDSLQKCLCTNEAYLTTVIGCIVLNAPNPILLDAAFHRLRKRCPTFSGNITEYIQKVPLLSDRLGHDNNGFILPTNLTQYNINIRKVRLNDVKKAQNYSCVILAYFAFLVVLSTISNLCFKLFPQILNKFDFPLARKVRQRILLPPLGTYHHSEPRKVCGIEIAIPTRSQSFILITYFSLTITLLFVDYEIVLPNYSMPRASQQITKFLGNRTGMMILSQLNLLALFGRRNNFLLYFTGWNLDTFNIFHKWIGRVIFFLAVVHGAVESINQALKYTYITSWSKPYFRWGAVAMLFMTLIFIQSMRVFRVRSYEWFLFLHAFFAAILIPTIWWHISRPHDGYEFLYSFIAIWCYDRLMRLFRILRSGGIVRADVELCEGNQTIRFKISRRGYHPWTPNPGSYIFLYILRYDMFWQSHPFTVADYDDDNLIVYATVKNGITSSLKGLVLSNQRYNNACSCAFSILVEGPYGSRLRLDHYNATVYIAGGLGITALYRTIIENTNRKAKLIWVIPDEYPLQWFKDELAFLKEQSILDEIQVYITRSKMSNTPQQTSTNSSSSNLLQPKDSNQSSSEQQQPSQPLIVPTKLTTKYYKPDIGELVCDEMAAADDKFGKLAFVTCGPNAISDDVRSTISSQLLTSIARVDYFEENYSW